MDKANQIDGADKAFIWLLAILFGSCSTCVGVREWGSVERGRTAVEMERVKCQTEEKKP